MTADTNTTKLPSCVRMILDISTAHLKPEVAEEIYSDPISYPLVSMKGTNGFLINAELLNSGPALPHCLAGCLREAQRLNCDYV